MTSKAALVEHREPPGRIGYVLRRPGIDGGFATLLVTREGRRWAVSHDGATRPFRLALSLEEAVAHAREEADRWPGALVLVYGEAGTVEDVIEVGDRDPRRV